MAKESVVSVLKVLYAGGVANALTPLAAGSLLVFSLLYTPCVAAVAAINQQPWRSKVKVMVGGAPITQEFADRIGADAYTEDAASAAQKAKELVS